MQEMENDQRIVEENIDDSMEEFFRNKEVPPWYKQITIRSIVTSAILSILFTIIVMELNLTTGIIPSLNVGAGLLGYVFLKIIAYILEKVGFCKQPITRQENTVIQTCIVASSGIAFSSGTGSYLLGMTSTIASQVSGFGNDPINVKDLHLGWMIGFLFCVSFLGLFTIMPLRKMMILKYRLTYPSGTAASYYINRLHTPKEAALAKKKVSVLSKFFSGSFIWAIFQWLLANGDGCGFSSLPTFGRKAFNQKFFFDFSSTYVGVGMICPYMVSVSLLVGAIISWGILWPYIESKQGDWYSSILLPNNLHGIQGYKVFIAIAMMLGDGLFHFVYMVIVTSRSFIMDLTENRESSSVIDSDVDEKRRSEYFLKDEIPNLWAIGGYVILAIISIIVVPHIFDFRIRWFHILVAYLIAPVLAFSNAYGCGLTNLSLASNYGKIPILIFSAWVGSSNGGVIAGLAACGVMMNIVTTASDLIQDFKTGYLTLSSPRSMFFSQVIGTAMGCILTPLVFRFFNKAYTIGDPNGLYPAPYGLLYRGIALLGDEGFSSLPKHCLNLSIGFFVAAIVVNLLTKVLEKYEKSFKIYRFIPSPMCMAIPFYLGGYFAIDMCVGSLILFIWEKINKRQAKEYAPAVASGLISGDSLWGIFAAIFSLAGVTPPFCMKI